MALKSNDTDKMKCIQSWPEEQSIAYASKVGLKTDVSLLIWTCPVLPVPQRFTEGR